MARKDDVRSKVSIPSYFYNIIVPQLGSYYDDYPVDFDARPVACCPLHDEDTPSMRYYEETNSFYCFGCRAGGDVIQLHRLFTERQSGTKPTFDEAVDFLYSYFLQGRDTTQTSVYVPKLVTEDIVSSAVDTAMYCKYTSVLEGQLLSDHQLADEKKQKIWKVLDEMDILVDKNKINAADAKQYIQRVVRETI